ncbi:MAG: L,D-transpeptidase family protein [Deltaproteobacteria bacterium]|nr:L,D-transpeptidase family protein [Deltaproteobacteria bacterium]
MVPTVDARAHDPFSVVLVDKATHSISLGAYDGGRIEIKKKFHVTLGKAQGDKVAEKDLKTPEGIYFLTTKLTPPSLKKKFGAMAFMVNYPNPIDQLAGKTGYDIMLHSTDDPPRLKRDYDSEGCVVIGDDEISEIDKEVKLGLTPIIIYPELKQEYLAPTSQAEVRQAFDRWLGAWNGKDLETYIGSYSQKFHYSGMNIKQYRAHKASLNQRYAEIKVRAENLRFYAHPKYDVASFTMYYESKLKNGAKGFRSAGTKHLYFVKEDGALRILDESYSSVKED